MNITILIWWIVIALITISYIVKEKNKLETYSDFKKGIVILLALPIILVGIVISAIVLVILIIVYCIKLY